MELVERGKARGGAASLSDNCRHPGRVLLALADQLRHEHVCGGDDAAGLCHELHGLDALPCGEARAGDGADDDHDDAELVHCFSLFRYHRGVISVYYSTYSIKSQYYAYALIFMLFEAPSVISPFYGSNHSSFEKACASTTF